MRILLWSTIVCVEAAQGALALPLLAAVVIVGCAETHASARRRGRFPNRASRWHEPPDLGAML
jgi:hypothetical protein